MIDLNAKRSLEFGSDETVEITIATNAGACFGVVRAIKLGYQALARSGEKGTSLYSFGPLIHNPHVVKDFKEKGVQTIAESSEALSGTVLLRSHGVQKEVEADLKSRGLNLVDATCPLVKKPQRIAKSLGDKGYFLVVVGDANHPEIKGVLSYFGKPDYLVTYDPQDVDKIPSTVNKVGVLAQTTIEVKIFDQIAKRIQERFNDTALYNTICDATSIRQTEAELLAKNADVMIVVGGKNSSNTTKLVKICEHHDTETYHIENLEEIKAEWFVGKKKIGVTGGASTPHEFVDLAGETIAQLLRTVEA